MSFITKASVDESIRCPGQLYYNPTSIATEAGWGTLIGLTDGGVMITIEIDKMHITQEETGSTITDVRLVGINNWMFVNLRSYNATVLKLLYPGLTSGLAIDSPGTLKMGISCITTDKILFVPNDRTNYPAAYWKNIATQIVKGAKVSFDHAKDAIFPMSCLGLSYQQKALSGIVL